MAKPNPEFTKGLANVLVGAKTLLDYGIESGQVSPEQLRLTVMARQAEAKKLVASGVSRRKAAKVLGVSRQTIDNDVGGQKLAKSGKKLATSKNGIALQSDPIQAPCTDCKTPAEFWETSLSNLASDDVPRGALARAVKAGLIEKAVAQQLEAVSEQL
jgi:hypothetical protein